VTLSYENERRLESYLIRSAQYRASDPHAWRFREMAGEAVKRRVRQGQRKAAALLQFPKRGTK
jgi:hypothetical protein